MLTRLERMSQPRPLIAGARIAPTSPTTPLAAVNAPNTIASANRLMPGQMRMTTARAIDRIPLIPIDHRTRFRSFPANCSARSRSESIAEPPGLVVDGLTLASPQTAANRRARGCDAESPQQRLQALRNSSANSPMSRRDARREASAHAGEQRHTRGCEGDGGRGCGRGCRVRALEGAQHRDPAAPGAHLCGRDPAGGRVASPSPRAAVARDLLLLPARARRD